LNVDSVDNGDGGWSMVFRPWHLLTGFAALIFIVFAVAMVVVAYTPILDTIPGNPGAKSRQILIDNIVRLDSLERKVKELLTYSDNVANIVDGRSPHVRNVHMIGDSIDIKDKDMVPTSAADSALRAQMEGSGEYSLASSVANASRKETALSLYLHSPSKGEVVSSFNPTNGEFGVKLAVTTPATVSAVKDGTIVAGYWSPEEGYVITIQHSDNLLSTYRYNTTLQKSVGSHVRAGEVIATVGQTDAELSAESDENTAPQIELELWYKGSPINPQEYIVF
jgi:murein DD-endopeptidase MepM/ murein hydrolase activator NlpD